MYFFYQRATWMAVLLALLSELRTLECLTFCIITEPRVQIFTRIYQVLYYGSGLGKVVSEKTLTHVYPMELREEIRRRFDSTMSSGSRDAEFQENS
jgi:hypothetical protein